MSKKASTVKDAVEMEQIAEVATVVDVEHVTTEEMGEMVSKDAITEQEEKEPSRAAQIRWLFVSGMSRAGAIDLDARELEPTANCMVVLLTYWLSFEYVRDPRHALEPDNAQAALLRGAQHVLNVLAPYLESGQRQHLLQLTGAYRTAP